MFERVRKNLTHWFSSWPDQRTNEVFDLKPTRSGATCGRGAGGDVPVAELKSQLYVASEIAAKFDGLSC